MKTESGGTHTVLLPTGSGTSKEEPMMLLTGANVREGRRGSYFEGGTPILFARPTVFLPLLIATVDESGRRKCILLPTRSTHPERRRHQFVLESLVEKKFSRVHGATALRHAPSAPRVFRRKG